MEIFLVGGAVRDELLGLPVRERDWVVVGSSPDALRALGYRQVGRDFPVFLHPVSREEYALARTERKSGPGHTGFVCHAGPDVTLEQDLLRRDLTINAMARDAEGRLIDPYGGARDLEQRVLRHVSEAFDEDPLRLFRVARFAAQLPGFDLAPATLALLARMAAHNALAELSAERVWGELDKALAAPAPGRFFEVLAAAEAWAPWFTELRCSPPVRSTAVASLVGTVQRFALLCAHLDAAAVAALCRRLRAPRRHQRLAEQVARHWPVLADWRGQPAADLLDAFTAVGAFAGDRNPEDALTVVERLADCSLAELRRVLAATAGIRAADFGDRGLSGKALGQALQDAREAAIARARA